MIKPMKTGENTRRIAALFFFMFVSTALYAAVSEEGVPWKEYLLGQIGVSVRVEENKYNVVAEALRRKEEELNEREKTIVKTEEAGNQNAVKKEKDKGFIALAGVTSVLGGLLVLNFYLDWRRRK